MSIADWLAGLGLNKYAQVFSDNEIDLEAARHLNEEDLKELGLPLGPRRKILAAKASLDQAPAAAKSHPATRQAVSAEAERRHLTVMFVDLVGSTQLSTRLDPEEMGRVIRDYQNAVAGEIARLDGHVAKFLGDGVMAYFGWPRAFENEAERAVRAGLAVLQSLKNMKTPGGVDLNARIGIASGLVVVGDLIGEGSAREEAIVGETPNLAARVQSLAEPGQIVMPEATLRLLGGLFEVRDLGRHSLKGIDQPVRLFAVAGERLVESRFAARRDRRMQPIIGRDQEIALLRERWTLARAGEGQMVLLTGEAGIGKSRITETLLQELQSDAVARVRYQCSPYHADSSFYPVIQQMTLAAGFQPQDDGAQRLDKLEALLGQGAGELSGQAPYIADLLGLPGQQRYGALDLSPQQIRHRTLRALIEQAVGLSRRRPLLWVIEDVHWIDPTTLEAVELALAAMEKERIMMLITARPTFQHGFGGHPIVTRVVLNRLGRQQVEAIATRVCGGRRLPDEVLEEIAARTDGVPLFIEEIAKSVVESGALELSGDAYRLAGPISSLSIPATLHDSLMARLDRLRPAKEVAQIASIIGRNFDYRTLAEIATQPGESLDAALDHLAEAELIFRRGKPPDADYVFKHALVRDAAYESLLKSRRQKLHAKLLEVLEGRADSAPEILAHHAEEAGEKQKAILYWEKAADTALAKPAYREAVSHFQSALRLLGDEPMTRAEKERRLRLLVNLGQALIGSRGYGAPETVKTFATAKELAAELGDTPLRFAAIYGDWAGFYMRSIENPALAESFLKLCEESGDAGARLVALRTVALARLHGGRFAEALAIADEIIAKYDPDKHRELAFRYAHDAKVAALIYRSWTSWHLGKGDQALKAVEDVAAWARELNHPNTTGLAMTWGAVIVNVYARRHQEVLDLTNRHLPLFEELGAPLWINFGRVFNGWARSMTGDVAAGVRQLISGLNNLQQAGARRYSSFIMGLLAEAHGLAGDWEASRAMLAKAFQRQEETGDQACAADLLRLAGDLALRQPRPDLVVAEDRLRDALDLARRQGSKAVELRAANSLARLWHGAGKTDEARELLAPLYQGFTEGFDFPDLKDAAALLKQIG